MHTWFNIIGGLMIFGPLLWCFVGATKGSDDITEGFKCAGAIGFAWALIAGYTFFAIWLIRL